MVRFQLLPISVTVDASNSNWPKLLKYFRKIPLSIVAHPSSKTGQQKMLTGITVTTKMTKKLQLYLSYHTRKMLKLTSF